MIFRKTNILLSIATGVIVGATCILDGLALTPAVKMRVNWVDDLNEAIIFLSQWIPKISRYEPIIRSALTDDLAQQYFRLTTVSVFIGVFVVLGSVFFRNLPQKKSNIETQVISSSLKAHQVEFVRNMALLVALAVGWYTFFGIHSPDKILTASKFREPIEGLGLRVSLVVSSSMFVGFLTLAIDSTFLAREMRRIE